MAQNNRPSHPPDLGALKGAFPQARPQERNNRRRTSSHPPTPSCQDSLFSEWGHVEDYFDPRTKLGIVFSRPLAGC